ncbi:MAG: hypothetical protein H0V62_09755 [Gammaproteobacteria bacterium]|nr:hypothetical protein [Gammaproteobacteria bacterium]
MKAALKVFLGLLTLAILLAVIAWLMPAQQRSALLAVFKASSTGISATDVDQSGDEEGDDEAPQRALLYRGEPAVKLTPQEQRRSGIRTAPLEQTSYRAEDRVYGDVINILPLLLLRARFAQARAVLAIADARLQVSMQEYERLRGLNVQVSVISAGRMRQAQSRWEVDQAQRSAAETRIANTRAQAVQKWGVVLTTATLEDDSERLERLAKRDDVLLRLSVTSGEKLSSTTDAFVDAAGNRHRARKARFISVATQTDPLSQGETYFFAAPAEDLRTGMRVSAWIARGEDSSSGLLIPGAAAIWYAGRPWAYVQVNDELFARRMIPAANMPGGWFAHEGFSAEEPVVITGGQMLLSEEFRWQIPEEDDD